MRESMSTAMGKAITLGVILFIGIVIARAPAGMISLVLQPNQPVGLLDLDGTLWSGSGNLLVSDVPVGRLHWSFRPVTVSNGRIGYDLELKSQDIDLTGWAATNGNSSIMTANGLIKAAFVNIWLAPYDIQLSGEFKLSEAGTTLTGQTVDTISGTITWTGGPLTYVLSNKVHRSSLPPLRADLGPGPVANAYPVGETTPLLSAELKADGFARIGVTKYLTKILGNPWPGGDPDHAVVLEVEEKVF